MKLGVVTFPGSNCDRDALQAGSVHGFESVRLWHKDTSLPSGLDVIILPGGFSYGDYLRTGAIARFSPIMAEVISFANAGGLVMGICNGFQILCEAGLLPGALIRNAGLSFVCKDVYLRTETVLTPFSHALAKNSILRIPVAHGEGRYVASPDVVDALEGNGHVLFRYVDAAGTTSDDANPNGSTNNIAGIVNTAGNVMGMMPHPERYVEGLVGGADGRGVFESLVSHLAAVHA
jgi:phosphoribosylformylglycinamidine synthase subunit PurQ / glutaminase